MIKRRRAKPVALVATLACKDGVRRVDVDASPLLAFGQPLADKLVCELVQFSRGRARPATATAYSLNRWGTCISDLGIDVSRFDLTSAESLDELHLQFLEWFFTRNPAVATCSLATMRLEWNRIGNFIRFCQRRNSLPAWDWFVLPTEDANAAREGYVRAHPREFIGQPRMELDHSDFLSRVICSRSLAIGTPECLEQLAIELQNNLDRIEEACYQNIDIIRSAYEAGNRLAEQADVALLETLTTNHPRESFLTNVDLDVVAGEREYVAHYKIHAFSPSHPNGLANLIWWAKNRHNGCLDRLILEQEDRQMIGPMVKHDPTQLRRYLGVLRYEDLSWFVTAIACACPALSNPSTILNLEIDGLTFAEDGSLRITSIKNRAREERSCLVTGRLRDALLLLRELTASCRHVGRNHPFLARSLFLGWRTHQQRGLPHRLIESNLAGKLLRANLANESDFADLGLTTYSMIRNTHAILEYIRSSGDWRSVSKTLGNSISISMRHYVPPEIKNLLRERKVRQHQNEMLYVASIGREVDPLSAMDLSSRDEIERFLSRAIKLDVSKTNVLLRALARMVAERSEDPDRERAKEAGELLLSLTENNLALLFRFEECLGKENLPKSMLHRASPETGVSPAFWCSLADCIRRLFEAEDYDNLEHKILLKRADALLPQMRLSVVFDSPS